MLPNDYNDNVYQVTPKSFISYVVLIGNFALLTWGFQSNYIQLSYEKELVKYFLAVSENVLMNEGSHLYFCVWYIIMH